MTRKPTDTDSPLPTHAARAPRGAPPVDAVLERERQSPRAKLRVSVLETELEVWAAITERHLLIEKAARALLRTLAMNQAGDNRADAAQALRAALRRKVR